MVESCNCTKFKEAALKMRTNSVFILISLPFQVFCQEPLSLRQRQELYYHHYSNCREIYFKTVGQLKFFSGAKGEQIICNVFIYFLELFCDLKSCTFFYKNKTDQLLCHFLKNVSNRRSHMYMHKLMSIFYELVSNISLAFLKAAYETPL